MGLSDEDWNDLFSDVRVIESAAIEKMAEAQ